MLVSLSINVEFQDFWKLTRLRHLNISDNRINQLASQIGNFTLLTHLDISRNDIRSLPDELGNLVNLAFLDISANPLSNRMLPGAIWRLQNLRKLSANDVCLSELPENICKLVNILLYFNLVKFSQQLGFLNLSSFLEVLIFQPRNCYIMRSVNQCIDIATYTRSMNTKVPVSVNDVFIYTKIVKYMYTLRKIFVAGRNQKLLMFKC